MQPRSRTTCVVESKNRQATDWKTSHQISRHGYVLLLQVLQRLKVRIEDEFLPCLFFRELSFAFVLGIILDCAFIWLVRAKMPSLPFDNPFLPLRPLFHQANSSSVHFRILCLFFAKGCSSVSFVYSLVLSFFLFPFLLFYSVGGLGMGWTARHPQCRPSPLTRIEGFSIELFGVQNNSRYVV